MKTVKQIAEREIDTQGQKRKWIPISLHVLIWLTVFLIPYIFSSNIASSHTAEDIERRQFLYLNTGLNCFWLALFYFNSWELIPQLIYKRKTGLYVLSLLGALCGVVLWDRLLFFLFITSRPFSIYHSLQHNFLPFVFTLAVSAAYKAITDKTKADIRIREKESENLKTELSFLRSQVSPHFLFNVLNNIVALVRLKSEELEPTVLKLSSLMQYMLYETDEEKVVLKSETEYLKNYIDLQKQRFGEELLLNTEFDVKEDWHTIEPMLLIPFVENAFKHGNGLVSRPEIDIRLEVKDDHLHFRVKNRFAERESEKDKTSGIGLANVKRRLELLYPGKHSLSIDKKEGWFIVNLDLTLQ